MRTLAQIVNIRHQELYAYESGQKVPRDRIITALAQSLTIDPDVLLYGSPENGDLSPFYAKELGDGYGREYTLQHIYDPQKKISFAELTKKLKNLTDDELAVIAEMADNLYLDSHPEELEKIAAAEEAAHNEYMESTKKYSGRATKMQRVAENINHDLYMLFPEKFDEWLDGKKSLKEIDREIFELVENEYPELLEVLTKDEKLAAVMPAIRAGTASFEEAFPVYKKTHSVIVPRLARMLTTKKRKLAKEGKLTNDEVYEANVTDHIKRKIREGKASALMNSNAFSEEEKEFVRAMTEKENK